MDSDPRTDDGRARSWWGWGWEDQAATDAECVALGALVPGLPERPLVPPRVEDLDLPDPRLQVPASLAAIADSSPAARASHARGKAYRDVVRALHGDAGSPPDVVMRPRDEEDVVAVLDWAGDATVDEARLAADVNELVYDYEGVPLKDIRIGALIREFAAIIRRHSIVLPPDLTLMFKALITMEGLGRQFDPGFHIIDHLTPMIRRAVAERYQPAGLVRRGRGALAQVANLLAGVPRDLSRLLRDARRGKTRIDLDLKRLDRFGRQLDRTLDCATMGIMTSSPVIGSAIVMTVPEGPSVLGVPLLAAVGVVGYVVAFVNSIWIILGIWRSGKD